MPPFHCHAAHLFHHSKKIDRLWRNIKNSTSFLTSGVYGTHTREISCLSGQKDRYNGIHLSLEQVNGSCSPEAFKNVLSESLQTWKCQDVTAVWLRVPIMRSSLIPVAAQQGFAFHHAEGDHSVLCRWMGLQPSRLPTFATHQIGVAGCVIHEQTKEVLVVRDRNRPFTLWKFPGGLAELSEDISVTAEREVLEETGILSEFQGILTFRQQHNQPGAFGRSDLFFLCHMRPLTYELKPCNHEIEACQWMSLEELAKTNETSAIVQRVIQLVSLGLQEGFDAVELKGEQFKSVYKGLVFKVFNRPLASSGDKGVDTYKHSLTETHKMDLTKP